VKNVAFLLLCIVGIFGQAHANSINFEEPINIDGQYSEPSSARTSAAERLRVMRRKLEKRNEQMIRHKMEQTRVQMEIMLMKQMQAKMNSIYKKIQ